MNAWSSLMIKNLRINKQETKSNKEIEAIDDLIHYFKSQLCKE